MAVYKDFFVYESGVYSRSQFSSGITPLGYHSVKIIGWGEETGTPYWVIIILSNHQEGVKGCKK